MCKTIKVVFLSTTENQGGAAKAVNRLHHEINLKPNISSCMVVKSKLSSDETVQIESGIKKSAFRPFLSPYIDRFIAKVTGSDSRGLMSFGLFGSGMQSVHGSDTDVICLTWVMGGYLSVEDIGRILSSSVVVWRLSDVWPFTGGCHYSYGCKGFTGSCDSCPEIDRKVFNPLSSLVLKKKIKAWDTRNLTLVAPSFWMKEMASSSSLFSDVDCRVIHTGVNLNVFKSLNMLDARKALDINTRKRLILFGAADAVGDERKGYKYLIEALQELSKNRNDFALVVFGSRLIPEGLGDIEAFPLGVLDNDNLLAYAYNACDVFVAPSIEENLANTVLESLACGIPVVAFDIGGMPDMIDSGKNGYLAKPRNGRDLMNGISWVLDEDPSELKKNAREKAELCFDSVKISQQYAELFRELSA